jgi:hypothetical protein
MKTLDELIARPLKVTKNTIQQTERNVVRNDATDIILEWIKVGFEAAGVDTPVVRSIKGIMIEMPNEELGGIPIEIILQMKPLDTDVFEEEKAHLEKTAAREEKVRLKAKKTARAIEERERKATTK